MEESKLSDLVFLQWDVRSSLLKTPKNTKTRETKTQITQHFEKVALREVFKWFLETSLRRNKEKIKF